MWRRIRIRYCGGPQGLSTEKCLEEYFIFPPRRPVSRSESKAKDSVSQIEIRKAVKRRVVSLFSGKRSFTSRRPLYPEFAVFFPAEELGRNPVSKHQIQPEYGDEQADAGRDG